MISKILNIFRRIDAERLHCISVLKNKHYDVTDLSTYSEVTNIIKDNIPSAPLPGNPNVLETDVYYTYPIHYNNPLDDPDVWKVPEDWPDLIPVLNNAEKIDDEGTGLVYYPYAIHLLEVTDKDVATSTKIYGATTICFRLNYT